jgi:hypothetical protein
LLDPLERAKNLKSSLLFTSLFVLLFSLSFAQSNSGPNVWLGTANGAATDWHHPANWSKGRVPSDLDEVLIPDLSNNSYIAYPVISYDAEARLIRLHPLARLTVAGSGILFLSFPLEMLDGQLSQIDKRGRIQFEEEDASPIRSKHKFATLDKRRK